MKIYVGNLPFDTSIEELRELFAAHGEVKEVYFPTEAGTGRLRGFAFVEMPVAEEAAAAIEATNGAELGGRTLKVNEARPRHERGDNRGHGARW